MENPDSFPTARAPLLTSVLRGISDDKALALFDSIATSDNSHKSFPLKDMNLSTKQYYSRISGLGKVGLIKRHNGKYSLTLLGKIVYDSQMIIGKTLSYYWKLKALESLEMDTSGLAKEEKTQLIDALIDNHQVKDILIKSISALSVGSNSKIQSSTLMGESN
jgi:hypothetical protein